MYYFVGVVGEATDIVRYDLNLLSIKMEYWKYSRCR